jgi:hypothetical protein
VKAAIPYESRLHAVVDPLAGLYYTLCRVASPQRLKCDTCGRTRDYMTARQREARAAKEPMVCGRLVFGRRTCPGELIRAEVAR